MPRSLLFLGLLGFASLLACAQLQSSDASGQAAPSGEAYSTGQSPSAVTFTLDFPKSQPEHYAIRIASSGPNHYESKGRLNADSDVADSFDFDFAISSQTRSTIFALAAKAGYFQTDLDAHRKHVAFSGKKTLRYTSENSTGEAVYNYSSNSAVQELTTLFQNLSATLEFGHRLDYDHRYQKLALDAELKRMEEMARNNQLTEGTAIQPILEQIVADQSVMNMARARAQRLIGSVDHH
ncbi:MAG: hypothetical protein WCC04_20225 [Terriglobales bacterium]